MATDLEQAISELTERLRRYPPERYPVQHATARFHLGVALLQAGEADDAAASLRLAAELFGPDRMPVEHAKTTNMLGAALRDLGHPRQAARAFMDAEAVFDEHDLPLERAAALFNLALARRDTDEADAAARGFAEARRLFAEHGAAPQAAAAARELGSLLLTGGDVDGATAALEEAVDLARKARDEPGLGFAANALGLAQLAGGEPDKAAENFRLALGAHPRRLRPDAHATAKANLAVTHERAGEDCRARLAARQAAAVPQAPAAVAEQARGVLERLGDGPGAGDLHAVLDRDDAEHWPPTVRDELMRWLDEGPDVRRAEAGEWIRGQLARRGAGAERAAALLGVVLEEPPATMEAVVRALVEALAGMDPEQAGRFRSEVSRAMARFHVPQWTRLRETFNRFAAETGQEPAWQ